jgi:putative ABC transport system permease protein
MEDVVAETFGRTRLIARRAAAFAIVAVGLAVLGVYGLLAYVVNRRTHDIGIRMALGASKRRVVREILLQGIGLGLAGVGLGLAASLAGTRLISSFLFGVRSDDPFTFAVVPAILFGVTLVACVLPARDAARIEPLVAVRDE